MIASVAIMDGEPIPVHFRDRADAGKRLAALLDYYSEDPAAIVVGIARGGVATAHEIAQVLDLPLDIVVVRKLAAPGHDEVTMGAIASGGVRAINDEVIDALQIAPYQIEEAADREEKEVERLERLFRGDRPPLDCKGKVVILVDDGLTTGSTLRAAIETIRHQKPRRIVLALPVGPPSAVECFEKEADEIVCLAKPEPFGAIGFWYDEFNPVYDHDVVALLRPAGFGAAAEPALST